MAELHGDQFLPGFEGPSHNREPVQSPMHMEQIHEQARAEGRERLRKANFRGIESTSARYSPGTENTVVTSALPIRQPKEWLAHPFENVAWRQARTELVPVHHLSAVQTGVNPHRVDELMKHPERGSNPRLGPGHHELPLGQRNGPNDVTVVNGNHRVHAQMLSGAMYIPMKVLDATEPGIENRLFNARAKFYSHAAAAEERTGIDPEVKSRSMMQREHRKVVNRATQLLMGNRKSLET